MKTPCRILWPRRTARIFAGIVTLLVFLYAEENWRGTRAWAKAREKLASQGEPLTREALYPPVPEGQNFFAAPIVRERLMTSGSGPAWYPLVEGAGLEGAFGVPSAEERPVDLRLAADWLREHATASLPPPVPDMTADLLVCLEPAALALRELREALDRPHFVRLESQWNLSNYDHLHEVNELLRLRGLAYFEAGRLPEEVDNTVFHLDLANALASSPSTLGDLVKAAAMSGSAVKSVSAICARSRDNAELARLEGALQKINLLRPDVLRAESINIITFLDALARRDAVFLDTVRPGLPKAWRFFPTGWHRLWQAEIAGNLDRRLALIQTSGWKAAAVPFAPAWLPPFPYAVGARQAGEKDRPEPYPFAAFMEFALGRQSYLSAARMAVAAADFRLRTGKLPSASEVSNLTLSSKPLPVNPRSNLPFEYNPEANGSYTITSKGRNPSDSGDDIVFRVPPPAP